MTTASLAVHVRVSAPLRQFLRVRSIQSIPISAQSVVLVHLFVLQRLLAFPNHLGHTKPIRGVPLREHLFFVVRRNWSETMQQVVPNAVRYMVTVTAVTM